MSKATTISHGLRPGITTYAKDFFTPRGSIPLAILQTSIATTGMGIIHGKSGCLVTDMWGRLLLPRRPSEAGWWYSYLHGTMETAMYENDVRPESELETLIRRGEQEWGSTFAKFLDESSGETDHVVFAPEEHTPYWESVCVYQNVPEMLLPRFGVPEYQTWVDRIPFHKALAVITNDHESADSWLVRALEFFTKRQVIDYIDRPS